MSMRHKGARIPVGRAPALATALCGDITLINTRHFPPPHGLPAFVHVEHRALTGLFDRGTIGHLGSLMVTVGVRAMVLDQSYVVMTKKDRLIERSTYVAHPCQFR